MAGTQRRKPEDQTWGSQERIEQLADKVNEFLEDNDCSHGELIHTLSWLAHKIGHASPNAGYSNPAAQKLPELWKRLSRDLADAVATGELLDIVYDKLEG